MFSLAVEFSEVKLVFATKTYVISSGLETLSTNFCHIHLALYEAFSIFY